MTLWLRLKIPEFRMKRPVIGSVAIALVLLALEPVYAQRDLTSIPDPDPEIERKSFQVADGFEVNLFAADPMLAKPIQMNWDAAGRLWIASSEVYPQIEPGQTANDKILILEDTDGDGRADKTTVFADGLLIPTGVEPDRVGPNGSSAFVANSTELLRLTDTDGDGKADESQIILSGFGTEDTHHILHTFRWGHDGMLYFNQSIYIHSHIETPWGVRRLGGGGIWQFRPESWQLEVLCRGFVNSWGHHFDDWGQSFATDGAYVEGINYVFPGSVFVSAPGATRILKGLNPGSPKHCGLEVVSGRHLPEEWRGNMLTNDFRGNRVCRFVISEDGSGYASREQPELIKTSHVAFRPIDIKMGPDGAIYIADWYNPIIQHGEVDFRDPRRDHTHGRIWRVTAKGRPPVARPTLVEASTESLLESLKSPEQWTRHFAKRLLKERGAAEVAPLLATWLSQLDLNDSAAEHHQLEALWTYQSLDVVEPKLLARLLEAKDHRVRAAATRVLAAWQSRIPLSLEQLAKRVGDDHPRVRLEAVRTISNNQEPRAPEIAIQAVDRPMDQFLNFALWQTMRDLEPRWLPRAVSADTVEDMGLNGKPDHLLFALQAIGSSTVVRPLIVLLRKGRVPASNAESVLSLIALQGGDEELGMVFDIALGASTSADRSVTLFEALAKAARQRRTKPARDLTRINRLIAPSVDVHVQSVAARLAGLWKVESSRSGLESLAESSETPDELRRAAMEGLASLGGAKGLATLTGLCAADHSLPVRRMAVSALASIAIEPAAAHAINVLADCNTDDDRSEIFRSFLERKAGPKALSAALVNQQLPADAAKIGVRLAKISGREQPELIDALTKAGGLSAGPTQISDEQMQQLVKDVIERGDANRGENVFRRPDNNCFKCHSIAGAGGQAGPDLISIGASAQIDYLIESLLDPNKKVKEGFHSVVVATNDGRVLTGIKVRQTDSELVLRNAEDQEISIPVSSIEEQKTGGSIMPSGLTDPLTHAELLDLVRFLSLLGKSDGPFAVSQVMVARRWQVLEANEEAAQDIVQIVNEAAREKNTRWKSVYSKVSGELPLEALQSNKFAYRGSTVSIGRCQLDVSQPGPVTLRVNAVEGLQLWLDQDTVELRHEITLNLTPGKHTLTFAIDLSVRSHGLRCELHDIAESSAHATFVMAK
jgi:putative heme-binding domain-containing protein